MKENHLKRHLKAGGVAVGATIFEWSRPSIARLLDLAGFDFLFLEYEHTYLNEESMSNIILAARDIDLPVVVKVPSLHRHFISRALDAGAMGIQLPRTNTRQDIDKMVQFAKFPPIGDRAGCPGLGNTDYQLVEAETFFRVSNDESLLVAHIETREGLENIDEVLDNRHVDAVFVGPYDLAAALGVPGQTDHPLMMTEIQRIIDKARGRGIAPGIYAGDFENGKRWIDMGMQLIETISDVAMLLEKGSELMRQFHAYLKA
jgi:4-hydroxy-2-oxoheptanedioate aldolase